MKFGKSSLLSLAMIIALLAAAMVGRQMSPLLLPRADVTGVIDRRCDLHKRACPATLPDGGRVEFSVTPRPIHLLQPLRLEVAVTGIKPVKVEVDFAGESMNMGYNRSALSAATASLYSGEASLPVCVSGSMTWVATVMIETERQRIALPYRIDVGR